MVIILISVKKFNYKRMSVIIIIALFSICTISLAVTKIVYDHIFARYDEPLAVAPELNQVIQQRQVCQFPSGHNMLTGYYYSAQTPNDTNTLVVLVPGFHAGGDHYLWQIRELMEYGWNIFTFDTTGTFGSQGKSQVGFSQSLLDLYAAMDYLKENQQFGHSQLVLIGHSRGAYAACCVLEQRQDIAAVVSVSGVNSAMEAIMQMSVQTVGPVSYGNYGFLWLYQASLFGADVLNQNAVQAISNSTVPVLVIHGTEDTQAPTDKCSIISHKSQITSAQDEYLLVDAGHTDLLYDADGTANDELIYQIHLFLLSSLEK